ncbi:MAG: hypothetical protein LZF60_50127 [Nitrospira sp.]|nr:MAG: hypothetical protein LZF60_50127 [Nitrospira sp.]
MDLLLEHALERYWAGESDKRGHLNFILINSTRISFFTLRDTV